MVRAVSGWSPVIILTVMPALMHWATAAIASSRGGSTMATMQLSCRRGSPARMSLVEISAWSEGMISCANASTRRPSREYSPAAASQWSRSMGPDWEGSLFNASVAQRAMMTSYAPLISTVRCVVPEALAGRSTATAMNLYSAEWEGGGARVREGGREGGTA